MDLSTADSSVEGLFEGNAPPSPSPAPRQVYPTSPKDITMASNLGFRPPPRPGSSTRKGRKSDFTTTSAPPPLPSQTLSNEYRALVDSTNLARNASPPDQSKTVDITRVARERLQTLRQENESQVNSAGMLGQGLLGLRTKIEALMDELADELADESEDASSSARIRILGERIEAEIEELEAQKRMLFSEIAVYNPEATRSEAVLELTETPSKATRVANAIRNLTATPGKSPAHAPTSTTPRPEDRRSRNAAARQAKADTDLINEIQAGLVQEVRRLQGLLKERDDQRVAIERSHAEVEKQLDQYKPKVIQMTEAEDALKQENWDLSVAKQNLEEQLTHINSALKKAELDNLRLNKDVAKARETADSQRLQIDSQVAEIDRLNKARDTEIALARRERAGMQRNVSDLQGELQRFRTQQLQKGSMSRSVSNSFMSDTANDDVGEDADALTARLRAAEGDVSRSPNNSVYSADGAALSPLGNRLGRDKEAQDLRAKLAMAQRKAGKDAAEKRRVRDKNVELKKLLVQSGVKIPQGLDDDAESSEDEELHWLDEGDASSPSVKRTHARSARPVHRPRLGKLMGMVSSDSNESIVEYAEYEDEQGSTVQDDSRASLDGMDPAFADMMATDPADNSVDSRPVRRGHKARMSIGGSPLARSSQLPDDDDDSPVHHGTIKAGRRSGAAAPRSISTVFQPSALGNELDGLALEPELPDLVTPALAERDAQHAEATALLRAEHDKFVEAIHADHTAAVEAIHATHAETLDSTHAEHTARIAELSAQHASALDTLKAAHQKQVDSLVDEHARATADGDEKHAAQLASAVAERTEVHEAAVAEARSRHSRALAEQVAASSAELAAAVALHKTSSEDAERKHRDDRQRADASHAFALAQQDRLHQETVQSLTVAHAELLDQARAEHARVLATHEQALAEAGAHLEQARAEHSEVLATKEQALQAAAVKLEQTLAEHTQVVAGKDRALADAGSHLESTRNEHAQTLASKDQALQAAEAHLQKVTAEHTQLVSEKEQALKDAAASLEAARAEHAQLLASKEQALVQAAAELEQTRDAHSSALAAKEQALQDAAALHEQTKTEHAELLADKAQALTDANTQLEQQRTAHSELEASHASTLATLRDTHSQELAARDQQLADAKAEIEKLQQTIKGLGDELDRLRKHVSELEHAHGATQRELDETTSTLGLVNEKVRRQEEAASELARQKEADAVAAAAAVAARSEALTATEAEKEQLQAAHVLATAQKDRQHNDALKSLERSHVDAVAQIRAEHKQVLAARDLDVQAHKDDADMLRSAVQAHKEEAQQLRAAVEAHKDEASKLRSTVQGHEEEAVKLRGAVDTHKQEADKLRGAIDTHVRETETLRTAVQTHKDESEQLRGTVKTHEDEASALRSAVQTHQDEASVLRTTVQTHKDEASTLRDAVQTHKLESDALRTDVQTHKDEANRLREAVQKHQDETGVLRDASESHRAEAEKMRGTVQTHLGEIEALRASVHTLEVQLARVGQESSALQDSRAVAEKQLRGSKAEYESLAKQHDEAKTSIASLQSKVRYLESAIAAEKSSTEQNRLSSDKELQTIQSALNTAHKKVRDQEGALSRMEAALAAAAAATAAAEAQLLAKNEMVTDTENEAYEDAVENVGTPRATRFRGKPEVRENSCQTDDQAWTLFQQQQQVATTVGQGGVVILGGAANRPRDSVSTFGGARDGVEPETPAMYTPEAVTNALGRRKSTDSTWSRHTHQAATEAVPPVPALPDKSKPPVMAMPGPPKMPPPPSVSRTGSASGPSRPLSPPPADLLARAQQRHLQLPANGDQSRSVSRASSRNGPPPSVIATSSRIRQPSSGAASLRSRTTSNDTNASNAQQTPLDASMYSTMLSGQKSISSRKSTPGPKGARRPGPRASSAASFVSDVTSEVSRRLSMMSSAASEAGEGDDTFTAARGPGAGLAQFGADATDPAIIHAITQTMIGEYMYKYTRKSMGRLGHSDKRHKRYFWVHPYTKTLYWTLSDPGGAKVSEGTSKSASIEHVRVVEDLNPSPPGLHHESLIVTTASREVKMTAPSRERHEAWLAALEYLVRRPTMQDATAVAGNVAGVTSDAENDPSVAARDSVQRRRPRASASTIGSTSRFLSPQHSFLSRRSTDHPVRTESTPHKGSVLYPSVGKRSGSAAKEWLQMHEYDRETAMSPTRSVRAYEADLGDESYDMLDLTATQSPGDPRLKTAEEMLEEDEPEGFDGLTNVRACCDGRHDVGSLAHTHTHTGYSSDKGSRKSSRLHRRQSSGGSRFSSIGLRSKLDRAADEPVPRLPASILAAMEAPRDSTDSSAKRPRVADATFANLFAPTLNDTTNTAPKTTGPSYGERIQKIKLRQSLDAPTNAP